MALPAGPINRRVRVPRQRFRVNLLALWSGKGKNDDLASRAPEIWRSCAPMMPRPPYPGSTSPDADGIWNLTRNYIGGGSATLRAIQHK